MPRIFICKSPASYTICELINDRHKKSTNLKQHLNSGVIERLKVMFLQGNINKNMKLLAEDILEKLKNMNDDSERYTKTYPN